MKKMDQFEKMVNRCVGNPDNGPSRMGITNAGAATLLRRQHAVYVQLVEKAMGHRMGVYVMIEDRKKEWISRTDLLAAFTRYRKGARSHDDNNNRPDV